MEHTQRLLDVMAKLRDPVDGCEWDQEQTFESIAPYTIEEAYEVADAIDKGDVENIKEELGDLLFQVVFQSQVASDSHLFDFEDVAKSIADKMIRRHPHVFGARKFTREELKAHWERSKAEERASKATSKAMQSISALDGVALPLPALTRAEKMQKRASRVGFDWQSVVPVLAKVDEELSELRAVVTDGCADAVEEELGDLLFSVTNVARHLKVDPEVALRKATAKFEQRFRYVEREITENKSSIEAASEEMLDQLWQAAKQGLS